MSGDEDRGDRAWPALVLAGTILSLSPAHRLRTSNAMGPLAFLLCIVAVAVMIVLGVTLGGRNNPRRRPPQAASRTAASTKPRTCPAPETAATQCNS